MKNDFAQKAALVRKWIIMSTTKAQSGHATSALSAADIGTVLFDKFLSYDIQNPKSLRNDRFILSKGHASPLLYTLFAMSGAFSLEELKNLRKFKSKLEGHPNPRLSLVDVASGSLGQGLSVGCGMSLLAKKEGLSFKTYVLLGDGEIAEGSNWEAANFASFYKLDNLIAIVDVNRLGQSQETMFGHDLEEYMQRFSAFGWEVLMIDGHNYEEIDKAFDLAVHNKSGKPFAIIAKTKKGKGISFVEDKNGWHGVPLKKEDLVKALSELGDIDDSLRFTLKTPKNVTLSTLDKLSINLEKNPDPLAIGLVTTTYKIGDSVATREVFGKTLSSVAKKNSDIYALDADVKNSTFTQDFKNTYPERFIECFIAEQNMVGVALGLSALGKTPFVSTFAAFFTRAFDQIRMAAISDSCVKFVGSHAGVSIGEDGPSQMGLEDIAMFGAIPNTVILHPADVVATTRLIPQMVDYKGIAYLRTLRAKTPVIYSNKEKFSIGGSKILKQSMDDVLTVAGCGITIVEALKAYEELKKEGIMVCVVDCYSIKPIDHETLIACTRKTKENAILSVEDHFAHGGLGDFIAEAVNGTGACVTKLAVTHISRSGTSEELLDDAGISAKHIVAAVKNCIEEN